jgi:murein tripeptide amidase MpaA
MWRKNRQTPPSSRTTCYGRDINRQWPYQWDSNDQGASPDPCDETYRGESPSDGPESQGLTAFVNKLRDQNGIKLYIDWHSYGQHILSPWGYVCNTLPADSSAHVDLAAKVSQAIQKVEGKKFDYGPSCSTLYATTGDSVDYVHGPGKSNWSYTIELRDTGNSGFVLPPAQIIGSAKEQWEGMKLMLSSLE